MSFTEWKGHIFGPAGSVAIARLDRLTLAYLAVPLFVFFVGWFELPAALLLCLALLAGLLPVLGPLPKTGGGLRLSLAVIVIFAALVWASLGGAGHLVYANLDWPVRDAVLHDLVVADWPPTYGWANNLSVILRCPVAYYLPAAVMGKLAGFPAANFFLLAWTAAGTALFLLLALSAAKTPRQLLIGLMVMVFFSGMDIIGYIQTSLSTPALTDHLEWWAVRFQYSSNTTQLFWVPNHALPGWLAAALFYRNWRNHEFLKIAPMLIAVMPLWSPLPMIGLLPFLGLLIWHHLAAAPQRVRTLFVASVPALIVFLPCALYLTLDSTRIPSGWAIELFPTLWEFGRDYAWFVLLEFGLLAFLLCRIRRDPMVFAAVATLTVLPLYFFGPANDLVMRASIPALAMLSIATAEALAYADWQSQRKLLLPLVFVLTVGSTTAIHEFARAVIFPRWQPAWNKNLLEVTQSLPPHYVGQMNRPALVWMFKKPESIAFEKQP